MEFLVVLPLIWHLLALHVNWAQAAPWQQLPDIEAYEAFSNLSYQYLTDKTAQFWINGTAFPHIPLDIGESYGGSLPVSSNPGEDKQLYFWFFPSNNTNASSEITIWLNGGPGCSSLLGIFQENGKFLWQKGTAAPALNYWSWTKLTNMVWIDQPAGAGFAQGAPTANGTADLAVQFVGFWKNFVDTFDLNGRKVFLTGESYAGKYIPYFGAEMLAANDVEYFNLQGTMIIDPVIGQDVSLVEIPMLAFAESNQALLRFNSSFRTYIREVHDQELNYTSFFNKYYTFPSQGPMPIPPNYNVSGSHFRTLLRNASFLINPCFNIYHITDFCPGLYDPFSIYNTSDPDGGGFFNQTDVQDAMHAPRISYHSCLKPNTSVYAGEGKDLSPPVNIDVLPKVFNQVPLNIVANGALDMLIPSVGTLFALQNVTWRGKTGLDAPPEQPFVVPLSNITTDWLGRHTYAGPAGELGSWGYERGVIFVDVQGAGHMIPQYNPSAAYRLLEVLLGRVGVQDGMSGAAPWSFV